MKAEVFSESELLVKIEGTFLQCNLYQTTPYLYIWMLYWRGSALIRKISLKNSDFPHLQFMKPLSIDVYTVHPHQGKRLVRKMQVKISTVVNIVKVSVVY